jgi:hypothetical protein
MNPEDFPTPDADAEALAPGALKARIDDEDVAILEPGPNNCAASQESLAGD